MQRSGKPPVVGSISLKITERRLDSSAIPLATAHARTIVVKLRQQFRSQFATGSDYQKDLVTPGL